MRSVCAPKEIIALRSPQQIMEALTAGIMREPAAGMSAANLEAVVRYLKQSVSETQ